MVSCISTVTMSNTHKTNARLIELSIAESCNCQSGLVWC